MSRGASYVCSIEFANSYAGLCIARVIVICDVALFFSCLPIDSESFCLHANFVYSISIGFCMSKGVYIFFLVLSLLCSRIHLLNSVVYWSECHLWLYIVLFFDRRSSVKNCIVFYWEVFTTFLLPSMWIGVRFALFVLRIHELNSIIFELHVMCGTVSYCFSVFDRNTQTSYEIRLYTASLSSRYFS